MKRSLVLLTAFLLAVAVFSCSDDDDDDKVTASSEYVAKLSDFASYKNWEMVDYITGSTNAALGTAHSAENTDYSRVVYKSPAATMVDGKYKSGSILLKETFTWVDGVKTFAEMGGILAMVKRGEGYNPAGGEWEWFMIAPDLSSIAGRGGADMMDGMCNSCHTAAASQSGGMDFVFPHPTEYMAAATDFADYRSWTQIGEESGPSSLLGQAHHPDAVRKTYKKHLLANPTAGGMEYPVGTVIVKEVMKDSAVVEIIAMVKRGANFNSANNGWEWFMLDPADNSIMGQGADLMDGMCNACHAMATGDNGIDYVFKHANAPFNK